MGISALHETRFDRLEDHGLLDGIDLSDIDYPGFGFGVGIPWHPFLFIRILLGVRSLREQHWPFFKSRLADEIVDFMNDDCYSPHPPPTVPANPVALQWGMVATFGDYLVSVPTTQASRPRS